MNAKKIKICGINDINILQNIINLKIDYVGFIFYEKSPRYVDKKFLKTLNKINFKKIRPVCVYVNPDEDFVYKTSSYFTDPILQFHGNETALVCEQFKLPYIKAVRMKPGIDPLQVDHLHPNAGALLLDTYRQQEVGGTGASFDWGLARAKTRAPIILAGGLCADNVADALAQSDAWGVDVSTGVEVMPGIKDAEKIKMFCRTVREFDGQRRAC